MASDVSNSLITESNNMQNQSVTQNDTPCGAIKEDFFSRLDDYIPLEAIFSYLPPSDLFNLSQTSHLCLHAAFCAPAWGIHFGNNLKNSIVDLARCLRALFYPLNDEYSKIDAECEKLNIFGIKEKVTLLDEAREKDIETLLDSAISATTTKLDVASENAANNEICEDNVTVACTSSSAPSCSSGTDNIIESNKSTADNVEELQLFRKKDKHF